MGDQQWGWSPRAEDQVFCHAGIVGPVIPACCRQGSASSVLSHWMPVNNMPGGRLSARHRILPNWILASDTRESPSEL